MIESFIGCTLQFYFTKEIHLKLHEYYFYFKFKEPSIKKGMNKKKVRIYVFFAIERTFSRYFVEKLLFL